MSFLCFCFLVTAPDSHLGLPSHINLKQLHYQIILTECDKFYSVFHKLLAFWQNRTRKQEVGHCDLILLHIFFCIFIVLQIKIPLMFYAKFQPNIPIDSGQEVDFSCLSILSSAAFFIFDQAEFQQSEALQPCHAACEIKES